jgi:hypothetical protein
MVSLSTNNNARAIKKVLRKNRDGVRRFKSSTVKDINKNYFKEMN